METRGRTGEKCGSRSEGYREAEGSVTNIFLGIHPRKWKTNSRGVPEGGKAELKLGVGVDLLKKISWEGAKEFLKWEARSVGNS